MLYEGIFRRPRLWSNNELKKIAYLFEGWVVNVSGWRDLDKTVGSYREYILGDYDSGVPYRSYFINATKYSITNYPQDTSRGFVNSQKANSVYDSEIALNLEEELPNELIRKFDVVFCHTTLEHIFNIFKAFENLCLMSKDIVIVVVPFVQIVHDYQGDYKDYWRFTPFILDRLFEEKNFTILYRSSSNLFHSSIYYFYVASREPQKWEKYFQPIRLKEQLKQLNIGDSIFPFADIHSKFEAMLRKLSKFVGLRR